MPDKDGILKVFFENNDNVADVTNLVLADGEPLIRPEDLRDANPEELCRMRNGRYGRRYRDVCRLVGMKTDGHRDYLIVSIENQSEADYGMVGRILVENVMNYARQMRKIQEENRTKMTTEGKQKEERGDYLSGMKPTDRLRPVVTIAIYWGTKPWTGPVSFRELLEKCSPKVMDFQPDFKIPLLLPERIPDEKLDKLSKNMKLVLKYAGASGDKKLLKRRLESDEDFCSAPPIVREVLREVVGVKFAENSDEQGDVNMCYAQDELLKDARKEGIRLGEKEGRKQGLKLGEERGRRLGEARGLKLGEARGLKLGKEEGRRQGEARGLKLGEARGLKLGEARGLKLGEEQGIKTGEARERRKAIESLVCYGKRQRLTSETQCRMIMDIFHLKREDAIQYVTEAN